MKGIRSILKEQEGRRLEFKSTLPANSDLAKTVVAFANDAGGDIYLGVIIYKEELPKDYRQIEDWR